MATAFIGQDVYFYPAGDTKGTYYPAKVVKPGREVVDLVVFGHGPPTSYAQCVRHHADPKLESIEIRRDGCWRDMAEVRRLATESDPAAALTEASRGPRRSRIPAPA